jgi:hypothetical protein
MFPAGPVGQVFPTHHQQTTPCWSAPVVSHRLLANGTICLKGTLATRHFCVVKLILCFPLLCAFGLWADEAQNRAAIDKVIAALNDPAQRAGLFTKDVDSNVDFDRLVDLHKKNSLSPGVLIGTDETWTEMTIPRVVSGSIRFITPDVAIVHGASTIRGAVTLASSVVAPVCDEERRTGVADMCGPGLPSDARHKQTNQPVKRPATGTTA